MPADWRVKGSYLESCNCDVICPCRMISGRPGGRSTHGFCLGALSWAIEEGGADGVDLSGLRVVLSFEYDDDEPGSPWRLVLYLDERADERQRGALEAIFLGRAGGPHVLELPWVRKPTEFVETRTSRIEIGRDGFSAGEAVTVRVGPPVATDEVVTCIVPGHDRSGRERHGEVLRSDDPPFAWEWTQTCAYASTFDYRSG